MTNINRLAWDFIDRHIEIRKNITEGLINISALARMIAKEEKLEDNIDAIISAIRRYESTSSTKNEFRKYYNFFKKAKITTTSKLTSILIKRTDETEKKMALIYQKIPFRRETYPLSFEIKNHIKIIVDEHFTTAITELFSPKDIEHIQKGLGEIALEYSQDIIPFSGRLFALAANELGMNEVSIIDSMICHREQIIIVKEEELGKAFSVIFQLTKGS